MTSEEVICYSKDTMNMNELKSFQVVYQERSMNQAAKKLYITSQGLGRIIQNLEKELGVQLFERSARGVEPTEAAELLHRHADHLIGEFEAIESALRQLSESEKHLRIGCARGVLNALSFQFLLDFIEKNPELSVTWREDANDSVKQSVIRMQSDAGLVVGRVNDENLEEVFLASKEVRILVYCGHPFYERSVLDLGELEGESILILNEQYQVYHDFTEACRREGFEPHITARTEDSHFLYKLCKMRQGLGVVLDFSVDEFRMDGVRAIPLRNPIPWDIYLIYQKHCAAYPNVRQFCRYIEQKR